MISFSQDKDIVAQAFAIGISDYIFSTSNPEEIIQRINVFARRRLPLEISAFHSGFLLNVNNNTLTVHNVTFFCTVKEMRLLQYLFTHNNLIINHSKLLNILYGFSNTNYLALYTIMCKLRKMLGKNVLTTIPKIGYKINLPVVS